MQWILHVYWPSPISEADVISRIALAEDRTNNEVVIHTLSHNDTYAKLKAELPGVTDTNHAAQLLEIVLDTLTGYGISKREAIDVTVSVQKMEFMCPEGLVTSAYSKGCGG